MNAMLYLDVAPLINDCPNCQNKYIGNGQGTLRIEDNDIERTCKCGFTLNYDVRKGTDGEQIKQAINESLEKMS